MSVNLIERLNESVLLGDSAMGTRLHARGLPPDRCGEELVLTRHEVVRQAHDDDLAAGARVIRTNSFGANRVKLARHGLEGRINEINWQAAGLAAEAAKGRDALVAGSVGPLGATLEEVRAQGLDPHTLFQEQIGALLDGGADFILFETFRDLAELKIALRAVRSVDDSPIVALMSCTGGGLTPHGVPMAAAFAELKAAGAEVLGVNSDMGPRALTPLFRDSAQHAKDIFWSAYPDAVHPTSPTHFAEQMLELVRQGVRLVGGGRGTSPEHIAALRDALAADMVRREK
jgi:homocysteine S-methyltransferase